MKTLTVRLPERLVDEIDAESSARQVSRSDVVRERLRTGPSSRSARASRLADISDLIGAVPNLPADLSARRKAYLAASGYGRKRSR